MTSFSPSLKDVLLTPGEVATLFRVNPKTVARWASSGKLQFILTMGGHRRFWKSDIDRVLGIPPGKTALERARMRHRFEPPR